MKLCTDCKHRYSYQCCRPDRVTGLPVGMSCELQRFQEPRRCGLDAEYWQPSMWYRIKKLLGVVK